MIDLKKDSSFLVDFEKLVEIGHDLSQQFSGLYAPTRRMGYSTRTLARIVDNSASILKLLPGSIFADKKDTYLDFPSVASLCRDLIEACNNNWYLSIEKIDIVEEELRLVIYDYHDTHELIQIAQQLNLLKTDFEYLNDQLNDYRSIIESNQLFQSLDKQKRSLLIKGKVGTLLTQFEIVERRKINSEKFKGIYKLLSNQTHTSANSMKMLAYSKIYDKENVLQKVLTIIIIEYCNRFLASTILNTGTIWNIKFAREDSEILVKKYSRKLRNKK